MAECVGTERTSRGPRRLLCRLWEDERGQDLTEYVLIILLVVIVVIATLELLGGEIGNRYDAAKASVQSATGS